MKTRKILVLSLVLVLLVLCLCACGAKEKEPTILKESDEYYVLKPTADFAGKSLLEFMNSVKASGELDFTVDNTNMITSINGVANTSDYSKCWMLYTSDTEHANTAWGQIEYNGQVYGSATLGAESLIIVENGLYIWVYTTF